MKTVLKYATAAILAGALALAAATPGEARGGRNAALIGGLAAGALIGAAVANANSGYYYGPDYYYGPGYAYEPAYAYGPPVYYAPAPSYRGPYYYPRSSSGNCGGSPGSVNYRPC